MLAEHHLSCTDILLALNVTAFSQCSISLLKPFPQICLKGTDIQGKTQTTITVTKDKANATGDILAYQEENHEILIVCI